MARGGLALAILAAVIAALIFMSAAKSIAQKLEGNIPARAENVEPAARNTEGRGVKSSGEFFSQSVLPVLNAGSEGSI